MDAAGRSPPPGAAAMAAAIEHVLLSYLYLDDGNLDGYASLLDEEVQVQWPGLSKATGRADVLAQLAEFIGPPGKHRIGQVIANGDHIVTLGRWTAPVTLYGGHRFVDFVDVCTVSTSALLISQRRYCDVPQV